MLELPDGSRYEGEFKNGEFHGVGTLFFPEGKVEGTWANGKQMEGKFTFVDGLEYAENNWKYCAGSDRRFFSEKISSQGIKAAGELSYHDTGIPRVIPVGYYDTGNGIYTPATDQITAYDDSNKRREPSEDEREWILRKAPTATAKRHI